MARKVAHMGDPTEYIAFLEKSSELEILASFCGQEKGRLSHIEIISLTMEVNLLLEEKGVPFKSVWEVVGEDISVAVEEASGRLAEQWFIPIFKDCFHEVAAWYYYQFFFCHALVCRTVVNRALRDRHHKTVLLFPIVQGEPSSSLFGRGKDLTNGVFGAVLQDYVKRHHLKSLALAKPGLWQRTWQRINPWQRLVMQIARDMKHCRLRKSSPCQGQEVDILFTNWGYDLERHVCIDEILKAPQLEGFKVGHIVCHPELYNPPSSPIPANHFVYELDLSLPSHLEYLGQFLVSVFVRKYLTFLLKRGRLRGDARFILSIPNLGCQHLYFFFFLYRHIYLARKFVEKVIRELGPRVIVTSDAAVSYFGTLILVAREKGVPVISVNHGYYLHVPWKDMFPGDRSIVGGEALRQNFIEAGVEADRIVVVGNPRFSQVFSSAPSARKTIIILTSGSGTWSSGGNFLVYQHTVSQLCEVLSTDSRYEVVIKSHPWADYHAFYDRLIRNLSRPNLRQVQARLSEDMIKECSVVILPGIVSGAVLEFLQYQVPCIYLTTPLGEYQKRIYRMNGVGITLSDASEVKAVVDRLHEDRSFRASVIENGLEFLRRHTELGDNSLSRFIQPMVDVLQSHTAGE